MCVCVCMCMCVCVCVCVCMCVWVCLCGCVGVRSSFLKELLFNYVLFSRPSNASVQYRRMFNLFYKNAASQTSIQSQAHFQWSHKKYLLLYVVCFYFGLYSKIHPF